MKTRYSIKIQVAGTGVGAFTVPPGVRCDRAHNLPKDGKGRFQYWCRSWPGMSDEAKTIYNSIGILLTVDDIKNGNQ